MQIHEFIERKELIEEFAKELAYLQKKADKYYYVDSDREMADFMLNRVSELKDFAIKLGICEEMYNQAYKIYDFRNSGKKDYIPDEDRIKLLKKWSGLR